MTSNFLGDTPVPPDTDGDGVDDNTELNEGTGLTDSDSDDDNLSDGQEKTLGTNPLDDDSDNDGIDDGTEVANGTNPNDPDDPGEPNSDSDGDGISDSEEIELGTNPNISDTDGDGIDDGDEVEAGINPTTREFYLPSPVHMGWNSYLGMVNILEIYNRSSKFVDVLVAVLDNRGEEVKSFGVGINSKKKVDFILNDFQGFPANSFGTVKPDFPSHTIRGRVSHYYSYGGELGFNYSLEAVPLLSGTSHSLYNTFSPSTNPDDSALLVENWLSVINAEDTNENFNIERYNGIGELVFQASVSVPAFGRVDIENGHFSPGRNDAGVTSVIPERDTASYQAFATRYGANETEDGEVVYEFATGDELKAASDKLYIPFLLSRETANWMEVANVCDGSIGFEVSIFEEQGINLLNNFYELSGKGSMHLPIHDLAAMLGPSSGSVIGDSSCLVANGYNYSVDENGSVQGLYSVSTTLARMGILSARYNTFFGLDSVIVISNLSSSEEDIQVRVIDALGNSSILNATIRENGGLNISLLENGIELNSYGTVEVVTDSNAELVAYIANNNFVSSDSVNFSNAIMCE